DFRIATWNVKSLYKGGALKTLVDLVITQKVDICAIQEMRWLERDRFEKRTYTAYYSWYDKDHIFGTGHDIKLIIGDLNAQIGKKKSLQPIKGQFSLHEVTNDNCMKVVDYAASKNMAIASTNIKHKKRS
ncbi:hypothetical protein C0J52_13673, partial [Blattella germanica]